MEGLALTTAKALEAIPIRVGHPEERGGLLIALGCTIPERPTKDSSRSLDIGSSESMRREMRQMRMILMRNLSPQHI